MARESDAIPLVSVVIPTLNRSILLGRAIDTVLAQTYRRVEVVVVDDGSSDGTSQRVAQIGDQRVRYVRHPRTRGLAAARNTGIRHARGQYVALLDDDDEIVAEKLERQLAALHESADPAATVCYTRVIIDDGVSRRLTPARGKRPDEPVADYLFAEAGTILPSSVMADRALFRRLPFDERLRTQGDFAFYLHAEAQGCRFLYVPESLTVWNQADADDRLSLNPDHKGALAWINSVSVSPLAHAAFVASYVAPGLAQEGRRLEALRRIGSAARAGAVPRRRAVVLVGRAVLPPRMQGPARRLLARARRAAGR